MKKIATYAEALIQLVIWYGLATYFVELEFGGADNSKAGHPFFLWSERAVAAVFTVEYLTRWFLSKKITYPFAPLAIIDLLAVLPFYIGFLVDLRSLRIVRTLRVLRLLKIYRYNTAIKNLADCYRRVKDELYILLGAILLVVFLSGTIIYEAERAAQPDHFASYSDGLWWSMVTLTTVGYGDKYPITLTGKLVAAVTLLIGLGIFGSFVSVIGGAFVFTIHEQKGLKGMRVSERASERIRQVLAQLERPANEEEANMIIEAGLDALSLGRGSSGEWNPLELPSHSRNSQAETIQT